MTETPPVKKSNKKLLIGLLVLGIGGCTAIAVMSGGDPRLTALTCAKQEVRRLLKAPSTADFPMISYRDGVSDLGGNRYGIRSYVEAENSFGAKIRSDFVCEITVTGKDSCSSHCEIE